jgi:hypothetical protein
MAREKPDYGYLSPDLLALLAKGAFTKPSVREFFKVFRAKKLQGSEANWKPMWEGQPVPLALCEAAIGYINDTQGKCLPVAGSVCRCPPPDKAGVAREERETDIWFTGWSGLFRLIFGKFAPHPLAAVMIVRCLARAHTKRRLTEDEELQVGESIMGCQLDQYARFLTVLHTASRHAVMFGVSEEKGNAVRCCAAVSVPLIPEAFYAIRNGILDPVQISPEHIQVGSAYLHMNALGTIRPVGITRRIPQSRAQMRATLYQWSSLIADLRDSETRLHVVTFAGTNENGERARAFSFRSTGHLTPVRGFELLAAEPPPESERCDKSSFLKRLTEYEVMHALLQAYQAIIKADDRYEQESRR